MNRTAQRRDDRPPTCGITRATNVMKGIHPSSFTLEISIIGFAWPILFDDRMTWLENRLANLPSNKQR